jgi:hypothetical protein
VEEMRAREAERRNPPLQQVERIEEKEGEISEEVIEESDARGKQVGNDQDCTVEEDLRSELATLKDAIPSTLRAIIEYGRQAVQMFFSPGNAIADFKRKVKELWNIPVKMYHLLINGAHESRPIKDWPMCFIVRVAIRGSGGNPDWESEDEWRPWDDYPEADD